MSRQLVTLDWTTGATLEAGYPASVATGLSRVDGVQVVRVQDVADPAALRYEAVQVAQWSSSGGQLAIDYLTGLEVSKRYLITLEVLGA